MTSQCGKNKNEASKKKNPELNNIGNMKKSKFYKYHAYLNRDVIPCVCPLIDHGSRPMKTLKFLTLLYNKIYTNNMQDCQIVCLCTIFKEMYCHVDLKLVSHIPDHSLLRFDVLEARHTSKIQNRGALFDVELYLTAHKYFISTSINIIHSGCTFHLSYPYWTITSFYENTMSSITVTVHKLT